MKLCFLLKKEKADIPRDHEQWKELSREPDVIWALVLALLLISFVTLGRSLNLYEAVSFFLPAARTALRQFLQV